MTNRANLPYRPCAGVCLLNADGLVFAGQRIDTPGAWQMPQGGIDAGEDPRTAALRELEEETSVPAGAVSVLNETEEWLRYDLPEALIGTLWNGRFRGQKQKWFLMRLEQPDTVVDLNVAHPEFAEWRWMRPEALNSVIVPFKRDLYTQILTEFGLLPG